MKTMLKQANELLRKGQYESAIKIYRQVMEEVPEMERFIQLNLTIAAKSIKSSSAKEAEQLKEHNLQLASLKGKIEEPNVDDIHSNNISNINCEEDGKPISSNKLIFEENDFISREDFGTEEYYEYNPDVKQSKVDAYDHWLEYGIKENRIYFRKGEGFPQLKSVGDAFCSCLYEKQTAWPRKPLISIIMPVFNTNEIWLREALDSVLSQIYQNWELCIADDFSTYPHITRVLDEYAKKDSRIKIVYRNNNGGISAASNSAIELVNGEYTVLLDHDDLLEKDALFYVVESILDSFPDIIYTDEKFIDKNGNYHGHAFRPAFSLELLRSHPYIVHMVAFRTNILRKIGGFNENITISQDYDLILRAVEQSNCIVHIPKVLYTWRIHETSTGHAKKENVMSTSKKILSNHLARCGENATVHDGKNFNFFNVDYNLKDGLHVAIIIPTKNYGDLVRQCIDSIKKTVTSVSYEIIVVDHNSDDVCSLDYFNEIANEHTVLRCSSEGFNFSRINNWAISQLRGKYSHYLLCNNDVEAIQDGWLESMLKLAQQPDVGMVGAKLYYPDFKIQHAGVCVGWGGAAEHFGKFMHRDLPDGNGIQLGYLGSLIANREVSAVTAACALIRVDAFESVNGFDEQLEVGFGDVDICLRVIDAGYRIIFCADAELIHHESISRGKSTTDPHPADSLYFFNRWHGYINKGDPYYNPNLSLVNTDWRLKNSTSFPLGEPECKPRVYKKKLNAVF
ncbi:glycosyltransferase family 2 protein [Acidithiobacillus sp.]|uniref:glycosyltransferase family 2 protein n=1 Tax=Acidithiobacillus sp. TaxID=1872118 RepID=UPI002639E42A|nr:glycosyltransferase family 2 protein [Acidithiobacillus sp.]MDD5280390.1 glycosyltransferase family 2 protein [Acidithiobacillus sp.]